MSTTKVSDKYQIVIPKSIREKLNLKQGQYLSVFVLDNGVYLSPKQNLKWPDDYIGSEKDFWSKIDVAQYLRGERNSWD